MRVPSYAGGSAIGLSQQPTPRDIALASEIRLWHLETEIASKKFTIAHEIRTCGDEAIGGAEPAVTLPVMLKFSSKLPRSRDLLR